LLFGEGPRPTNCIYLIVMIRLNEEMSDELHLAQRGTHAIGAKVVSFFRMIKDHSAEGPAIAERVEIPEYYKNGCNFSMG